MNSPSDTIAAIATPVGEGGIGVVRVSGVAAIDVVERIFSSSKGPLAEMPTHTCRFGFIRSNRPIDQVVVTVFRAPESYTGENTVEISAHGSPYILKEILALCLQGGARLAAPGEFTARAFLNGKLDLTQAEAVAELIRAKTEHAHAAAVGQLEGHLSKRVRELRDQLLPLLAHVEVGLDHSDDNHEFLDRTALAVSCRNVSESIAHLIASAGTGKLLRDGFRVSLLGRPNVGKSSLLNSLLKEERAIVTPIAGTTRDTLEEWVNWDGLPVVLTDTAGLRASPADSIEKLGIERTRQALEKTDFAIGIFDSSHALTDEDHEVLKSLGEKPHLWVANKSDLPVLWPLEDITRLNGGGAVIAVSAKTGEGLSALVSTIKRWALETSTAVDETRWLLNARHRDALTRAQLSINRAAGAAAETAFEECVALELRAALTALGEIIGETTTEDLLGQIFSTFCIGK